MDLLDWLAAALGDDAVAAGVLTTDPALLDAVRTDRSGWTAEGRPVALVNATRVEHVQATLRAASEFRVPVVPRGAGTGLAGGANGTDGAIVLSVAGMDRILEISAEDQLAVVEPGVVNSDLNDTLQPYGLFFAPDPASRAISTVGGNIATNAGGLLCAKYGVTREAVLGLDVVLADGRLISTGHRTVKGVTGYDLTALFTGSEGTLGVIVGATVRLLPLPAGEPTTLGAIFPDVRSAAGASARITAAQLRPAVMELMDGPSLTRIADHLGPETIADAFGTTGGGSFLLVQFDGIGSADDAAAAARLIEEAGGSVRVSHDADEGERLLAIRRAFHPALAATGEVLIEDVAVPRSRLPEMFDAIERISERYGIPIPTVAHAGDGNLHPNFVFAGEEAPPIVWEAAGDLFRTAVELGGTLTGEHGVGVLKRRWLADELGPDSYELQVKLKSVFDPLGILNPGKVFGR
ncbi:FAD-linked oxidase C-terminal domain-containing protein [Leifsonia sp. F6_8S_P_1B]|uniref:FAD-linked oxidase C-terminal domain-containing protein n=1 Tax=Leifsonia williamsii TaxID=3035919 RepID=A0ABT8KBG0_9MICO|nr:FAD-linked oxidase C-terminal domain-containing protein [Leifsonia williamsii]MDN4614796.1 FAD-linked oxidase C-terminal domain-containing protein [Leifsonia williamsii]